MIRRNDGGPRRVSIPAASIVDFLAATRLFAGCDRATIEKIAPHVFAAEVGAGVVIMRAGTPKPGIGFVYSGRAAVRDGQAVIEEVAPGEAFGVTGAFLGTAPPQEVAAAEDSVVFLPGHDVVVQLASKVAAFLVRGRAPARPGGHVAASGTRGGPQHGAPARRHPVRARVDLRSDGGPGGHRAAQAHPAAPAAAARAARAHADHRHGRPDELGVAHGGPAPDVDHEDRRGGDQPGRLQRGVRAAPHRRDARRARQAHDRDRGRARADGVRSGGSGARGQAARPRWATRSWRWRAG